ncbi:MAG: HAD family hydrolase, partial [Myxococcales bacterium]|nr:HAD family hydrolase [Myxococcales bacterium]
LFDTLVDLRQENLPTEEHHGMQLPASVHAMHAALSERAEIPFERFTLAMAEASRVFAMSHFARDREVPTRLRFEDVVRRLGLADPELPEILTGVHMGVLRSEVAVPAHHAALLGVLRRRVRLGVCSNFSHSETALGILEEAGLRAHLDAIVVSDTFGLRKPRVEIFQEVLARLGVRAEEGIHVGDSLSADVQGAAALGLRSVWLTRRVPACDARLRMHAGARPDHVLPDLAELPRLLDALA